MVIDGFLKVNNYPKGITNTQSVNNEDIKVANDKKLEPEYAVELSSDTANKINDPKYFLKEKQDRITNLQTLQFEFRKISEKLKTENVAEKNIDEVNNIIDKLSSLGIGQKENEILPDEYKISNKDGIHLVKVENKSNQLELNISSETNNSNIVISSGIMTQLLEQNPKNFIVSITKTLDGGYIVIGGQSKEEKEDGKNYWVKKIDNNGDIVWKNSNSEESSIKKIELSMNKKLNKIENLNINELETSNIEKTYDDEKVKKTSNEAMKTLNKKIDEMTDEVMADIGKNSISVGEADSLMQNIKDVFVCLGKNDLMRRTNTMNSRVYGLIF